MRFLLALVLVYLVYAALLFAVQRRVVFVGAYLPADVRQGPPPSLDVELHRLETPAGGVDAWYLPAHPKGGRLPAMIYAHGNGELVGHGAVGLSRFAQAGLGVLMVEYPGYGTSDGQPSHGAISDAMTAAYDWLIQRPDVDPEAVVGFGRSLGTGVISELGLRRPLAGLVLQSPYTRTADLASRYLVPGFLVRDRFDNLTAVEQFTGPVWVFHGTDDEIIPFRHGEAVARVNSGATLIPQPCAHNDCPVDWNGFVDFVVAGLAEAGIGPSRLFQQPDVTPPDVSPGD